MLKIKKITVASLIITATLGLAACQHIENAAATTALGGQYVSEGYAERAEGNDWVMVSVADKGKDKLAIKITSRDDIKKPTCSFSGEAVKKSDYRYEVNDDGSVLVFKFDKNRVSISSSNPIALHYYCSGGASLADTYTKL
ncbi:hypothetical protein A1D23_01930 [Chelonobacter oris]|uniref:hypothetical protein n=1 Tax=Chelonobacter oris TaxID=505317 RepID=UPI00244B41A5|nr:hypothetical protein [Chelonobacter oris]MDH3000799.1 hypothetical protein [Chelonobacter oris]